MDIIRFLKEYLTADTIAVLTISTVILSQLLALIEYYRLKARWDFLYIDDEGRKGTRSGFHPEYLSTSLLVILSIVFLGSTQIFNNVINNTVSYILAFFIVIIVMYICAYSIFYIFSGADVDKGIFDKDKYSKITAQKAGLSTFKYSVQVVLWFIILKLVVAKEHIPLALILIITSGILLVCLEYNDSKIRIRYFQKIYNIVAVKNSQEATFCIISTINNEKYYAVKAKMDDNTLVLYLDTKTILPANELQITKMKFDKIVRMYNGNEIQSSKFRIK